MCGIAGYYQRTTEPVSRLIVSRMAERLAHRGPDDQGVWVEGPIGLGHRRLSIRDLSSAAHQPFSDPSGRIVVSYNGELYNDRELRRELERDFGFVFRTHSDTELLPFGYLAWGETLFERLEGMFAFALWDRRHEKLILARDGIGIKPLYYHAGPDRVLFASELKALLTSGLCERKVDTGALHTYLGAGFPGPSSSLVQGISQVKPGTFMSFSAHGMVEHTFWKPTRSGEIEHLGEALEEFSSLLPLVVSSQLVSDVPVGVFQSSGIDSTLVSLTVKQLNVAPPLFTAGFSDESHDESKMAAMVAQVAGLPHYVLPMSGDQDPIGTFKSIAYYFDGQCADTGAYAFYQLCREVRKHCSVVLSGDGGDEFFGGYETYKASQVAATVKPWMPTPVLAGVGRAAYYMDAANESRLPWAAVVSRFALGLAAGGDEAHMQWRRLTPEFLLPKLYGKEMAHLVGTSPFEEYEACANDVSENTMDRWLLSDQRFHIQSVLTKVDAMSMAHGLEIRVPLLDRRIMDFAGRCALELLLPLGGATKYLLRNAAGRLGAPPPVLKEKKKGFNVPIANMLRNELAPLADFWLEKNPDIFSPYLNPDAVRNMWRQHARRKANHAYSLWPQLILAEWLGNG